jgi:hypothetical protein
MIIALQKIKRDMMKYDTANICIELVDEAESG